MTIISSSIGIKQTIYWNSTMAELGVQQYRSTLNLYGYKIGQMPQMFTTFAANDHQTEAVLNDLRQFLIIFMV